MTLPEGWPAAADVLDSAEAMLHRWPRGSRVAVASDGDVDGLCAGTLALAALERTQRDGIWIVAHRGEHPHTPSLQARIAAGRAHRARYGSRAGPIIAGLPTMVVVDHHAPSGLPAGALLVSAYRRVTALVNRELVAEGKSRVNHKRTYRVMRDHQLLLHRHTGKKPTRTHDGKVVTLKSNLRSDSFEIRCWNGDVVRVVFSLDCCDRACMRWRATVNAGVTGEMVRDLMVETVEHRFGAGTQQVPYAVEWLSDKGSCYTAHETVSFGGSLGLLMCTTPIYSPESNGMAEAFVKTVRRDYVYLSRLDDAAVVLAKLPLWIEDYNEVHPHKGLRMRSPREFLRSAVLSASGGN